MASWVVPKAWMPSVDRPPSWLDVTAPILSLLMAANSAELTAPRPAAERLPIWAAERPVTVAELRPETDVEERLPIWPVLSLAAMAPRSALFRALSWVEERPLT